MIEKIINTKIFNDNSMEVIADNFISGNMKILYRGNIFKWSPFWKGGAFYHYQEKNKLKHKLLGKSESEEFVIKRIKKMRIFHT